MYMYICICIYVYMYICIYVYMYTDTVNSYDIYVCDCMSLMDFRSVWSIFTSELCFPGWERYERPKTLDLRDMTRRGLMKLKLRNMSAWSWQLKIDHHSYKMVPQFVNAKLVHISPIKPIVYGRYNELVFMGFIDPLITGGHHLVAMV